jgi:multiple sugar transport system substrate-binding protein
VPTIEHMGRRTVLKIGGAAGVVAAAGGLDALLAGRVPPAFAQGTALHLLHGIDFVPEGDEELRRQVAEYERLTKVRVALEMINFNDLQPRITAAIQSGTGADIILMLHNWPHLYASALADVSDLAEWKQRDQGGFYPQSVAGCRVGGRWLALPRAIAGALVAYRRSWFEAVGARQPPRTLDEYRRIGGRLKQQGRPIGQTLGHTFGDAPTWSYPMLWAFGGAETDESGRRVVLNSPGTLESVRWMAAFWKEACDEGGLAWDDTNNNRAFHAGEISATLNGATIYVFARRNAEKIRDEQGRPLWTDIGHFPIPAGAQPTPGYHVTSAHAVMTYSRRQPAAKEFLRWLHDRQQFGRWFEIESGVNIGATSYWEQHPMWARVDEAIKPYRSAPRNSRMFGYAGPASARAAEAFSKYIITDMYAKAVQGMAPEAAVRWAEGELKKIYER